MSSPSTSLPATTERGSVGPAAPRWVLDLLVPALAYFAAARASIFLAIPPSEAAAVWPAAGIAIAILVLRGMPSLPGLLLGIWAFYLDSWLSTGSTAEMLHTAGLSLALTAGPLLQALLARYLLQRFVGIPNALVDDRSIIRLMLFAGPVGCLVAATVNLSLLWAYGIVPTRELPFSWLTWWIGDSIGAMVLTPVLLMLFADSGPQRLQRKLSVGVPLLAVLVVMFMLFSYARDQDKQQLEQRFAREVSVLHHAFEYSIGTNLETIRSLADFVEASEALTAEHFNEYTDNTLARHPNIQALEWIEPVAHDERAAFEHDARHPFPITEPSADGYMLPARARPAYLVVTFVNPLAGNERALGFDIASNPAARAAQQRALATGRTSATPPIRLIQESGDHVGFVAYHAARARFGLEPAGAIARTRKGLVAGVFRVTQYAQLILDAAGQMRPAASVRIVDTGAPDQPMYESDDIGAARRLAAAYQVAHADELTVGGRTWRFEYLPNDAFLARNVGAGSWMVLTGGMLLAALIGGWLLSLTGRTIQIGRVVEERTAFLREEISARRLVEDELTQLSLAVQHSPSMVMITDALGTIEYVNPKFAQVTGYDREELEGHNLEVLNAGEADGQTYADVWHALDARGDWDGELRNRRKDGGLYWAQVHIAPIHDDAGNVIHYVSVHQDITEDRLKSEQITYQASHDLLTGLINRPEFERRLEHALAMAAADGSAHALCFLDLDQFKIINDTSGHVAGDELLRQLSTLLQERIRRSDTLARLGGDEFGILMLNCDIQHAAETADEIRRVLEEFKFIWEKRLYTVGVSIGVVAVTPDSRNVTEVLKQADTACYAAKDAGRNRVHVYAEDDAVLAQRTGEINWVAELSAALAEDRFCLYGQPIVPIQDPNRLPAVELLIRLRDPSGQTVPPGAFLPAAERYNLSTRIDQWVIAHALEWLAGIESLEQRLGYCAINLSGLSLGDAGVIHRITEALTTRVVPPSMLMFEITETAAIANLVEARGVISTLRGLGCRFSLDDFGSGLSSFAYLKNLTVDSLKIDGMFVRDVVTDPMDTAIVQSINTVGHVLGVDTVAEFVENDAALERLREIGIDYAQGYGVCKPMPIEDLWDHPVMRITRPAA